MKKVNAVIGFTRIDEMDRVNDLATRLVKLTRDGRPPGYPRPKTAAKASSSNSTKTAVAAWEPQILASAVWRHHRDAHRRNFERRFSATAASSTPTAGSPHPGTGSCTPSRTPSSGKWRCPAATAPPASANASTPGPPPRPDRRRRAADLHHRLRQRRHPRRPRRSQRTRPAPRHRHRRAPPRRPLLLRPGLRPCAPHDPEDFLHGAACHCCSFASETSCETRQPIPRPPVPAQPAYHQRRSRARLLRRRP